MEETKLNTLPTLQPLENIEIPTKKLTATQAREYREYAQDVTFEIKGMLKDIKNKKINEYETENKAKIIDKIAKRINAKALADKYNELIQEILKANKQHVAIQQAYKDKLAKVSAEHEMRLATRKKQTLIPLLEKFDALSQKIEKNPKYRQVPYSRHSLTIDNGVIKGVGTRELNVEDFIDYNEIKDELHKSLRNVHNEFNNADNNLNNMFQALKEVMMFDETRMNEAFQKLFQFRSEIKQVHHKIMKED